MLLLSVSQRATRQELSTVRGKRIAFQGLSPQRIVTFYYREAFSEIRKHLGLRHA